jgi:hypothetical protein
MTPQEFEDYLFSHLEAAHAEQHEVAFHAHIEQALAAVRELIALDQGT